MSKFIPYIPTMKVSGMKIVAITVSTFMISFIRFDIEDIYSSTSPAAISRNVSTMSISWTKWS